MAVLPPPAPGCASCAARDAVLAEQARVLEEQAAAIGELRAGVAALAAEVAELRRPPPQRQLLDGPLSR